MASSSVGTFSVSVSKATVELVKTFDVVVEAFILGSRVGRQGVQHLVVEAPFQSVPPRNVVGIVHKLLEVGMVQDIQKLLGAGIVCPELPVPLPEPIQIQGRCVSRPGRRKMSI